MGIFHEAIKMIKCINLAMFTRHVFHRTVSLHVYCLLCFLVFSRRTCFVQILLEFVRPCYLSDVCRGRIKGTNITIILSVFYDYHYHHRYHYSYHNFIITILCYAPSVITCTV